MAKLLSVFGRLASVRAPVQSTRCLATAVSAKKQSKQPEEEEDVVISAFKEQQGQYRAFVEGMKSIVVPMDGNQTDVKKFASEVEALRKKIGAPEHHEMLEARMAYDLKVDRYDVHSFLTRSTEGKDFGKLQPAINEMISLSEGVNLQDPKTAESFQAEMQAVAKKHKIDVKDKQQCIVDMYTTTLNNIRKDVQEEMDIVKRRDHLENVEVDAASLKASTA